ncbi:MAG: hypothetical protein U1E60_19630 [Reyranellaceae bacterium]
MRFASLAVAPLAYGASLVLAKGVSLALMPWVAAHLPPTEYGRLELISSALEFVGLVLSFGLADTLFRFAGMTPSREEQRRQAAAVAGLALSLAAACGILLQLATPAILSILPLPVEPLVLRLSLAAIAVGGLVELPLGWLRLRHRPLLFLAFVALRAGLQLLLITGFIAIAPRAESVLAGSALAELGLATALLVMQWRATGVEISQESLSWLRGYSLPLLLGGMAAFALGSCDRWFLVDHVSIAELGQYGIAGKIGLATAFAVQPFGLWWYARRLRVLGEPDGLQRSADAVALGFAMLIAGAASIAIAGPAFVRLVLPPSYAPAATWIPWLVAACALNETASLLNVGCYVRRTAWCVTAVNAVGAAAAILGYWLLIPASGIEGAIAATLLAQGARVLGFLVVGHRFAPIPYRAMPMTTFVVVGATAVWLGTWTANPVAAAVISVILPLPFLALGRVLGMLKRADLQRAFAS